MELLVYFVITEGSWIKIRVKSLQVSNWKTSSAVQTKSEGCEDRERGAAASEASCRAPRTRRPAKIPSILFSKNTERCIPWISRPDRVQVQILTHTLAYIPVPSVTQPFLVLHLCQSCLHIHCTFFKARSGTCATLALLNEGSYAKSGAKSGACKNSDWTNWWV